MKENIGDRLWKSQLFSGRCDIGEAQTSKCLAIPHGTSSWEHSQVAVESNIYGLFRENPDGLKRFPKP
jgi:hypothetical protein